MAEHVPFFPDRQAYTVWIKSIPAIMLIQKDGTEELAEDIDGPYFYDPDHLILRVGGYYSALVRVASGVEADFTWYVAMSSDEGEVVFAALLCDSQKDDQAVVIGGESIQDACEAITSSLGLQTGGLVTRHLWRK